MKIVTNDNYCNELFVEKIIVENIDIYWGKVFVDLWNKANYDEHSVYYLKLVEDDYELYDGYKLNGYY